MNTGALRHIATLDVPNGNAGYLPLDPPTWPCAIFEEGSGVATLIGRPHAEITTAARVHLLGRTYHVVSIVNRELPRPALELHCTEVFG